MDARTERRSASLARRAQRAAGSGPGRDLGLAAVLVATLALVARPGFGLAAILAFAVLAARGTVLATRAAWDWARREHVRRVRRRGVARGAARVVTAAAVLTLAAASISYVDSVTAPSNSSFAIRSIEWLRQNGAAGIVSSVETAYYSLTAPSKGGPPLLRLPTAGVATVGGASRALRHAGYRPPRVRATIRPRLQGEGAWRSTQARFARDPSPPLLVTTYRPDPSYPRVVAGLAWVDPRRARIALYPGIKEPPGGGSSGAGEIPPRERSALLATFNSGFTHKDSGDGSFARGRLFEPLEPGLATLVIWRNGHVDVRAWRGGARPGPGVVAARQNLPLIVDRGRPNPSLDNGPRWGTTVGSSVLVWRSGVGVDRRGDLIYAAANDQTVRGLARILIHAGAVRAMELDINSYWVTLNTYAKTAARGARKLLAGMTRPAQRYLTPDDRDFFAVYLR